MSSVNKIAESAEAYFVSLSTSSTPREKTNYYNSNAEVYETITTMLDYRGPSVVANIVSSHFSGDREAAVVLDVACGTGLVAKQLVTHGFKQIVGVDGSKEMLELSRKTGLYQELKQCLLGEEQMPVQWGLFDVVVIVGALSIGHVPISVVRELFNFAKPAGYICMTTRDTCDNAEYKSSLENELKKMEEDGLWTCAEVAEKDWIKAIPGQEHNHKSGVVYLYKKI
ncbi:methyltransferase-like protein 27 [Brachionichthys hirsutus]|uniref:methyltransferase-like protein 27 n=1 Tax=Brachionichthys hirsutus TaxID=412623 RepID=UPI003604EDE9